ncbi:Clavaminate synthase-like protein [Trichoderma longibrachiatum]|uniref:Clavaminate synthase-like protein n=1 Tax=Trichoderma longibrachiatum ATCC 18648 TaxID=983965 RepID=A0A2T4BR59_TRILO|nr:Clavaminate synthase-like protein [Trichoderma longibrachiatum ATCC 18648]
MVAGIDAAALERASKILQIIDRYRLRRSVDAIVKCDEGALKFLALTYTHVKAGGAVPLCLPAFPFKSPNSEAKVLGKLPDRAEELALAHLHGLCLAIQDIYPPGAKLTIISDGLVYNDLLGVPDRDVFHYGETLRAMATARGYKHLSFSRLRDLVAIQLPEQLDEMTYVANASNFRRALLNTFSRPDWDWQTVSQSEDVCLTYRGYIKFLEMDLQTVYPVGDDRSKTKYKRGVEYIAQQMMARGDAFANAVRQTYKDSIRLSIHPSTGSTKLSISLLPTDSIYTTPWHCAVAYMLDGTTSSGMRRDFEKDGSYELVYENGRPSYFRERSDLFSWGADKGGVMCEPLYPSGWMFKPARGAFSMTMQDVDARKIRSLSELNSPVILRGFVKKPNKDQFAKKAEEFGDLTSWKFGLILEVKDRGTNTQGLNNVLSMEPMPFHYDGLFKTIKQVDEHGKESLVSTPPRFQIFVGATSSPRDTGFTLFSSSTMFLKYLPNWLKLEALTEMNWTVSTISFDQTVLKGLPLIVSHPVTGKPCLRYHEPWPQHKTRFEPTDVAIDGLEAAESAVICEAIDSVLYDRRVVYYHVWNKGDIVVSDNILMMHTRSAFVSGSDRELWRIHFD